MPHLHYRALTAGGPVCGEFDGSDGAAIIACLNEAAPLPIKAIGLLSLRSQ